MNSENFQTELNKHEEGTTAEDGDEDNYIVFFSKTKHTYSVDKFGNIKEVRTEYHSINYVLNGGTNPDNQIAKFAVGESVRVLDATKNNSFFQGWYETNDFSSEKITKIENRTEDVTLYAKWIEETPTDFFTWSETEAEATVTGLSEKGIREYDQGNLTTLAIPRKYNNLPVTTVGDTAFYNRKKIEELLLSDNIERLNKGCFSSCSEIKEIIAPISLNLALDKSNQGTNYTLFDGCNKIEKIKFTKGTGTGYNYGSDYSYTPWYYSRDNDISVEFGEGIKSIGTYTLYNCIGLNKVNYKSIEFTSLSALTGALQGDAITIGLNAINGTGLET